MPVAPIKPTTTPKPAPVSNPGLSAQERTNFQNKLITANLANEKKAALALKAEAQKESSPKLLAVANEKLSLITTEAAQRTQFSALGTYVASLKTKTPAELQTLKGQTTGNKQLAVNRELGRRAAAATSQKGAQEQTRLKAVKDQYAATLKGKSEAQLRTELTSLDAQIAAAKAKPQTAAGDKALRTLYAKRAVLNSILPAQFDRVKMHAYADSLKSKSVAQLTAEKSKLNQQLAAMSNGAIRGTREQLRENEVMRAIVDAALKKKGAAPVSPVKPVDKTRNPGNVVFEGPGMFVANPSAYPASLNAAKLKAAGVTWVSIQTHNPGPLNDPATQGFIDSWKAAGFKVGIWGVSYGNATVDGATAAQETKRYGADFYIADCEGSFQAGEGDVARNKQFVDAFQAEATKLGIGNIPRALSSMGRVGIDHQPWIQNGWDAMPQAYWNDWSVYEPQACAKFYEDWGWPKDRIHLTIGTYTPTGDATPKSVTDYVAPMKATGLKGFSYYLPESYLDDAQYQMLKDGIANGMNG